MAVIFSPEKKSIVPQKKEALRYLGYMRTSLVDEVTDVLIDSCIAEMQNVICPKAVYEIFDLTVDGDEIKFADVVIKSEDLIKNLAPCTKVALLAATIGMQADALIKKATKLDTVRAAVLQATGAMFIEEVVESVVAEIKTIAQKDGFFLRPRYSPGYGDVPLTIQKDFFRLLPCAKIGLSLMDTLIMAPEKSVTAFIGFSKN